MKKHTCTFDRIELELNIGNIRSIDVDHERRRIVIVADSKNTSSGVSEGATVPGGFNFTTEGDDL